MKKLVTLLFAMVILSGILTVRTRAMEYIVESETPGVYYRTSIAPSDVPETPAGAEGASPAAELIPLGTPTDLEWGVDHCYGWNVTSQEWITKAIPGMMSWRLGNPDQHNADVYIYRQGDDKPVDTLWISTRSSMGKSDWYSCPFFILWLGDLDLTENSDHSGTYYFTVTSTGDGITYSDSATAVSETYTYVQPEKQLPKCTNLSWEQQDLYVTDAYFATSFDPVSGGGGYDVELFYAMTAEETPTSIGGLSALFETTYAVQFDIPKHYIQDYGNGYYYYKVRALSSNINEVRHGPWSDFSPAYNLTTASNSVKTELYHILNSSASAAEKAEAVRNLDTGKLKYAMLADDTVADMLAQLEEQCGGPAGIAVSEAAAAFDKDKVSVVGAALNQRENAGEPISLILDKPEKQHIIDEAYSNSVAVRFSMTLDNVQDAANLEIPVQITLPVPKNINPDFLVILHYHADGTVEELWPYVYASEQGTFAEFVLTSFSDFIMTQAASDDESHVTRIAGKDRHETAFKIADMLKTELGVEKFSTMIIASGADSADALAGSYLAARSRAPILLSRGNSHTRNLEYIQANLAPGGTVYILGGTAAVPEEMENLLKENNILYERLKGKTRFDTNLAILDKAGIEGNEILVSTGYNFADSLSASASGKPILLLHTKANVLTDSQKVWLETQRGKTFTIIGGTGAVSAELETALQSYGTTARLKGSGREATSVEVAKKFFTNPDTALLAYSRNFPDGLCGGPLAYAMGAPLLLVNAGKEADANGYVSQNGIAKGYILGGTGVISDETARIVFGLSQNQEIPKQ